MDILFQVINFKCHNSKHFLNLLKKFLIELKGEIPTNYF